MKKAVADKFWTRLAELAVWWFERSPALHTTEMGKRNAMG